MLCLKIERLHMISCDGAAQVRYGIYLTVNRFICVSLGRRGIGPAADSAGTLGSMLGSTL